MAGRALSLKGRPAGFFAHLYPSVKKWQLLTCYVVLFLVFVGVSAACLVYTSYTGVADGAALLKWRMPAYVSVLVASMAVAGGTFVVQRLFSNPVADLGFIGVGVLDLLIFTLGLCFVPLGQFTIFKSTLLPAFYVVSGMVVVGLYALFMWRKSRRGSQLLILGAIVTVSLSAFAAFATNFLPMQGLFSVVSKQSVGFVESNITNFADAETYVAISLFCLGVILVVGFWPWIKIVSADESRAHALGVPVRLVYAIEAFCAAIFATSGFMLVGNLVFVGFVAVNLTQILVGNSSRKSFFFAMFLSASLMLLVQFLNTNLFVWNIPIGIIGALVAGPYFVIAFARRRGLTVGR